MTPIGWVVVFITAILLFEGVLTAYRPSHRQKFRTVTYYHPYHDLPTRVPKGAFPMIRSVIKTVVAAIVAWAAAKGIAIDEGALTIVFTGLAAGALNLASSWLAKKWPVFTRIWPVPEYDTKT